ncbi:aldo/keto reductase [Brevibacterium daeguense]|uniref:Aldo/keto reductase n=1 Tax=Brevibacterium daeguense TaxID=909936 RepID=A0ABP8EKD2_9MICO|nr:aldo/keto reductase [Brevibacterium daeguense]
MFPTIPLNETIDIPLIGLGTYGLQGPPGADAVAAGLQSGYRLIDTAAQYGNEAAVGEGIRSSGIDRDEIMVTTKVAGGDQGFQETLNGAQESLRRLGLDRIDILLIHWPNPSRGLTLDTWKAVLELVDRGTVRVPGVSNFRPEQLEELHDATGVWPAINQIQLSAALPRHETVAFHRDNAIVTQAWGPLGKRQDLMSQFVFHSIAAKHEVAPEQVALRWIVQQDIVAIPKSGDPRRQRVNADVFDFDLDGEDLVALTTLEHPESDAADSRTHEEW